MKKNRTISWITAESAGENARRALPRMAREFFAVGRTAAKDGATPAQLHAFRLATKRFRYTLELFEPMYGPMLAERLEQMRKLQSVLGSRQDCVVLGERLRKRAEDSRSLRDVLTRLSSDGRALEAKFRRFWHETFGAADAEVAWMRYLGRRPSEPRAPRGAIRKRAAKKSAMKKSSLAGSGR